MKIACRAIANIFFASIITNSLIPLFRKPVAKLNYNLGNARRAEIDKRGIIWVR
jgi:hypothetical protein